MRRVRSLGATVVALALIAGCGSSDEPSADTDEPAASSGTAFESTTPSAGCTAPDGSFAAQGEEGRFESGGQDRRFSISVPPEAPGDEPLPLVVNMHGALGNPTQQEQSSGFASLGREQRFVVVSPQALGDQPVWRLRERGPDLTFVEDLITETESRLCIDSSRVYLTGFSMGGMMSIVLACRDPQRYAAVAAVAGTIEPPECVRDEPVPFLALHGTADQQVRFDGSLDPRVELLVGEPGGASRLDIVEDWARTNGCDADEERLRLEPDVEHLVYECPTEGSVEMYVVDEGAHTWPGGTQTAFDLARVGPTTQTIDATEVIWDFFRAHRRAESPSDGS
jgi:polyhydroxybutyrate depolymerase